MLPPWRYQTGWPRGQFPLRAVLLPSFLRPGWQGRHQGLLLQFLQLHHAQKPLPFLFLLLPLASKMHPLMILG